MDSKFFRQVLKQVSLSRGRYQILNAKKCGLLASLLYIGAFSAPTSAQITPEIQIMLLETQLGACYAAPSGRAGANEEVEIRLAIDAEGLIVGEPKQVNPGSNTVGQRAIMSAATTAMGACLTSGSEANGETLIYKSTFRMDGITVVLDTGALLGNFSETADRSDGTAADIAARQEADNSAGGLTAGQRTQLELVRSAGFASLVDEFGLALDEGDRREIQTWLETLGYTTGNESGIFGQGTRNAILQWQSGLRVVSSGFLNREQADLMAMLTLGAPDNSPWELADHDIEEALELDRGTRAEAQARLGLLGFDPNGIDGAFGRGTRAAISAWQVDSSIPESGFFDQRQIDFLKSSSEDLFVLWLLDDANKSKLERASRAPASSPRVSTRWWRDSRGRYCRRTLLGTWCQAGRPRNP